MFFLADSEFWRPIVSYWLTFGVPLIIGAAVTLLPPLRNTIKKFLKSLLP